MTGELCISRGVLELLSLLVRDQVFHCLVCPLNDLLERLNLPFDNIFHLLFRGKHFHHLIYVPIAQHIASIVSRVRIECVTRTPDLPRDARRCGSCRAGKRWLLSRWESRACEP